MCSCESCVLKGTKVVEGYTCKVLQGVFPTGKQCPQSLVEILAAA